MRAGAGLERLLLGMVCPKSKECAREGGEIVGFKGVQNGVVLRGGTLQKGAKRKSAKEGSQAVELQGSDWDVRSGVLEQGTGERDLGGH